VAGPLILMKLTMLRREASGPRSGWVLGGAVAGLALAAATIGAATLRARSSLPSMHGVTQRVGWPWRMTISASSGTDWASERQAWHEKR
jgi:hypothetical protein